ncbi:hypothetical protein ABK040_008909 [Willaertia magna]
MIQFLKNLFSNQQDDNNTQTTTTMNNDDEMNTINYSDLLKNKNSNNTPIFYIFWLLKDKFININELKKTNESFHSVLFNCQTFYFNKKKVLLQKLVELNNENNYFIIIADHYFNKDFKNSLLSIVKNLKICIHCKKVMLSKKLQKECLQELQVNYVSKRLENNEDKNNFTTEFNFLESFIVNYYQNEFYLNLMNFIINELQKQELINNDNTLQQLIQEQGNNNLINYSQLSPNHPLIVNYLYLIKELQEEQQELLTKENNTVFQLFPLRKIIHQLHCHKSSILTNNKLEEQYQNIILISTGAFNPIHKMHLNMFYYAKEFLECHEGIAPTFLEEEVKRNKNLLEETDKKVKYRSMRIVGGYISPTHDFYVGLKMEKYGEVNVKSAISGKDRLKLINLVTEKDPLLCGYPWEVRQLTFISLVRVANTCSLVLKSKEHCLRLLMPTNPVTNQPQDSNNFLRICYVCGADLILRGSAFGFDYKDSQMLMATIGRKGSTDDALGKIRKSFGNLPVYLIENNDEEQTNLSSSRVRALLQLIINNKELEQVEEKKKVEEAKEELNKILPEALVDYMLEHFDELFLSPNNPIFYPSKD